MVTPITTVFAPATPVTTIDAGGCHVPDFATVLAYFQAQYQAIYGADAYLGNDSQDGQWLGIIAAAINDANAMAAAVYNAFSPATAQGVGLSSVVKINGITRDAASYSTCDVTIIGVAGTIIGNGLVSDGNNGIWALPAVVTIPLSGTIDVTATCLTIGAVTAAPGILSNIQTPTRGWQSVSNASAAAPGAPVEYDPQLRIRQSQSTMLPSQTILDGILGSIASLSGVIALRGYENDTNLPDGNGIPGHCIALVVNGGDAMAVAGIIAVKKTFAGTFGTTSEVVTDSSGISRTINFFRPTAVPISWTITLHARAGYTTDVQAQIQAAVAAWVNGLGIGNGIQLPRSYGPAQLWGAAAANTFEIVSISIARDSGTPVASDVTIAFNELAGCLASAVTITAI